MILESDVPVFWGECGDRQSAFGFVMRDGRLPGEFAVVVWTNSQVVQEYSQPVLDVPGSVLPRSQAAGR